MNTGKARTKCINRQTDVLANIFGDLGDALARQFFDEVFQLFGDVLFLDFLFLQSHIVECFRRLGQSDKILDVVNILLGDDHPGLKSTLHGLTVDFLFVGPKAA
ncbi:hypothetical protein PG990_010900 [Apiospora arundinis]